MKMRRAGVLVAVVFAATSMATAQQAKPTVKEAPEECILAINLARTAHLNTRISLLENSAEESARLQEVLTSALHGDPCEAIHPPTDDMPNPGQWWFEGDIPKCKEIMQDTLRDFLAVTPSYPPPIGGDKPWNTLPGLSIVGTLSDRDTEGACVVTQGCPVNTLVCKFGPSMVGEGDILFSPQFFEALKEREKAGLDISKMTEDDLNTPLGGGPGGSSGSGGSGGSGGFGGSSGAATPRQGGVLCIVAIAVAAMLAVFS